MIGLSITVDIMKPPQPILGCSAVLAPPPKKPDSLVKIRLKHGIASTLEVLAHNEFPNFDDMVFQTVCKKYAKCYPSSMTPMSHLLKSFTPPKQDKIAQNQILKQPLTINLRL